MPLLRRFTPGGATWTDADVLDPDADVPAYMTKFVATDDAVIFDIIGKVSSDASSYAANVGSMTADAYVGWEQPEVMASGSSPPATERPSVRRGQSVIETSFLVSPTTIRLTALAERGATGILWLDLASIPLGISIDVVLVQGGRPA